MRNRQKMNKVYRATFEVGMLLYLATEIIDMITVAKEKRVVSRAAKILKSTMTTPSQVTVERLVIPLEPDHLVPIDKELDELMDTYWKPPEDHEEEIEESLTSPEIPPVFVEDLDPPKELKGPQKRVTTQHITSDGTEMTVKVPSITEDDVQKLASRVVTNILDVAAQKSE